MSMTGEPQAGRYQRRRELAQRIRMRRKGWQRAMRLWSGVILFVFLTTHLVNHALGIFGTAVLEEVQIWRLALWQSWPGTALLYGSLAVHAVFSLARIMGRRAWRMPLDEALQIGLGLVIPLLLVNHVVGTRVLHVLFDRNESYSVILRSLWWTQSVAQTGLVIVAWLHGVIGIDHAFRTKPWFAPWRLYGLIAAVLLPVLALAGFVSGSREAVRLFGPPDALDPRELAAAHAVSYWAFILLAVLGTALLLFLIVQEFWRRRSGRVQIRYVGHGTVRVTRGLSILEASRINGIPHPARCGGRARCSTCRILVIEGVDAFPDPVQPERQMLERISAPRNVRLACQVHPRKDVAVQILLPTLARRGRQGEKYEEAGGFGEEQSVTVLVVDIRAFNTLVRRQLPHDLVIMLNRFIAEMTQTVRAHDGRVETMVTDGLTAVFGLAGQRRAGSRDAIMAAHDMLKVRKTLELEFAAVLPMPLRIGIGVHKGPAIVARVADPALGDLSLTMGETVSIAARLETATKTLLTDCLVSDAALVASGLTLPGSVQRELLLPGLDTPIIAHALSENALTPVPA
jgi:adenylate cyclase